MSKFKTTDPVRDAIAAKGVGKSGAVPGNVQLRPTSDLRPGNPPSLGMKNPNNPEERVPSGNYRPPSVRKSR
jgi:hypothetical protein